jgi:uncharacterized protein YyaL (SSP411 family)
MMLAHFGDLDGGGFFSTIDDHEQLILRPKDIHDGSTPSSNAMAVTVLLRLGRLLGRDDFVTAGEQAMKRFHGLMEAHPSAAGQMLIAYDFALGPIQEALIVGDAHSSEFWRVVKAARTPFAPHRITAGRHNDAETVIPMLAERKSESEVTLYLCENMTCRPPMGLADAVAALSDTSQQAC